MFEGVPTAWVRILAGGLILVHVGLGVWALLGVAELLFDDVPWTRLSNPAFSPAMLALQWFLIGLAAVTFVAGYFSRWRFTPVAMLFIYGAMASVCAYQTFFILTNPSRFRAMAIEYLEYALILAFLFYSKQMRRRFSRTQG